MAVAWTSYLALKSVALVFVLDAATWPVTLWEAEAFTLPQPQEAPPLTLALVVVSVLDEEVSVFD